MLEIVKEEETAQRLAIVRLPVLLTPEQPHTVNTSNNLIDGCPYVYKVHAI